MKTKRFFQWAMAAALVMCLPLCMTSCLDNNDNSATTEDDDDMPVFESTPTTDQLTVTSDKTLYVLTDYQPDESTVGKDCIIRHLLARFSNKKMVTDEASVSGMHEGDYMLLYLENSATADNAELRAAAREFIKQGGIVMFAETPAVNMETLLNHGNVEYQLPVMSDDQDQETDLVHVYFNPSYSLKLYHAKFDNFNTEQAEHITDYWLGKVADRVITETGKWVEEARNSSQAQTRTRGNGSAVDEWTQKFNSVHTEIYGSYYFPSDYYAKAEANLGGKTNIFGVSVDIWPMKVTDDQGNASRYYYGEVSGLLSFQNACLNVPDNKDYAYIWKKGGHVYKVNEMWGHFFEWQIKVGGVDANNVSILATSPNNSEASGSISEGISYSISGNVSGGYQGDKPAIMLSLGGGLNISKSWSSGWTDVTYENHALANGRNSVGGKFKFRECEAKHHLGSKGNVNVRLGASCARNTFSPQSAFLIRVNDVTSKVIFNFTYWVDMISYRAYDELQGKMDTRGFLQSWDCPIDLSGFEFPEE